MNLPLLRTGLDRESPFAFSCARCLGCCRHKKIQVSPYEIIRLAGNLALSTADFVARYTREGGTFLGWKDDGSCVFLDSQGCMVHPDRPLVCRLYPLGRHVIPSGEEVFSEIEPEPACKGIRGEEGRISGFLASQEVAPYLEAVDQYLNLLWNLYSLLQEEAVEPGKESAIVEVLKRFSEGERSDAMGLADVDAIIEAFCDKTGRPLPQNAEEKMSVHIQAIATWAQHFTKEADNEIEKE